MSANLELFFGATKLAASANKILHMLVFTNYGTVYCVDIIFSTPYNIYNY